LYLLAAAYKRVLFRDPDPHVPDRFVQYCGAHYWHGLGNKPHLYRRSCPFSKGDYPGFLSPVLAAVAVLTHVCVVVRCAGQYFQKLPNPLGSQLVSLAEAPAHSRPIIVSMRKNNIMHYFLPKIKATNKSVILPKIYVSTLA
jgi:hypothetical protein